MHSGVSEDWAVAQKSYLRARNMAQWGLEPTFKPGDLPPASCPHVCTHTQVIQTQRTKFFQCSVGSGCFLVWPLNY